VLGIKPDDRLVKIKNEKGLYKDVLAKNGVEISKSYTPSRLADKDKFKNERGGRE
jgi:relaxase/mobilization nuclease domain protein